MEQEADLETWEKISSRQCETVLAFLRGLHKSYNSDSLQGPPPDAPMTVQALAAPGRLQLVFQGRAMLAGDVRYTRPMKGKCWRDAWEHRSNRPRLLLADAGMGKTFFSRWMAGTEISAVIGKLEAGEIVCDEARFPIWLRASELVERQGKTLAECLRDWVRIRSEEAGCMDGSIEEPFYENILGGGQDWNIYIDSLDQLEDSQVGRFKRLLGTGGALNERLILTSRHEAHFRTLFPDHFPECDVLELLPLNKGERKMFLQNYKAARQQAAGTDFGQEAATGDACLQKLERTLADERHPLCQVAAAPLLLRFLCDLAAGGHSVEEGSINDVYQFIIDSLLRGRWLGRPVIAYSSLTESWGRDGLLIRTRAVCAKLFFARPGADDFSRDDWTEAWTSAWKRPETDLEEAQSNGLLSSWVLIGLVESELSGRGAAPNPRTAGGARYVFRHRTLLEYLVANYLANLDHDERKKNVEPWLGIKDGEFYACHHAWTQTFDFLAGHPARDGKEPSPAQDLIEVLGEKEDDHAWPLLALQVRWAAMAGESVDKDFRKKLAGSLVESRLGAGVSDPGTIFPPYYPFAREVYQDLRRDPVMLQAAIERLKRKKSTYGLGLLGLGGSEAIKEIMRAHAAAPTRSPRLPAQWTGSRRRRLLGCLIDLARTGDDAAVVEWAKVLWPESGQTGPQPPVAATGITAEDLVRPLLVCGGRQSFLFLREICKPEWWDPQAFQAGLGGPNAEILSQIVSETIDPRTPEPALVGINRPGYDEALARLWLADRVVSDGGSPSPESKARWRTAGRVLLLRRSVPSHSIIKNVLGEDLLTIGRLEGREVKTGDLACVGWMVAAIRAAAEAGLADLRDDVVKAAKQARSFQARYAAAIFLCQHGKPGDLATLREWLDQTRTSSPADRREWLTLGLKVIEAHLRLAPAADATEFVRDAIANIVQSGEGWRHLRIEETPEGVRMDKTIRVDPDAGDLPARASRRRWWSRARTRCGFGAQGAFVHALWLVANGPLDAGQQIFKTVEPMFFRRRAIYALGKPSTHVTLQPVLHKNARYAFDHARARLESRFDGPSRRRRDGDLAAFRRLQEDAMNARGVIIYACARKTEWIFARARELMVRVNFSKIGLTGMHDRLWALQIVLVLAWSLVVGWCWALAAMCWKLEQRVGWQVAFDAALAIVPAAFVSAVSLCVWRHGWQFAIRRHPDFSRGSRARSLVGYLCGVWLLPAMILLPTVTGCLHGTVRLAPRLSDLGQAVLPVLSMCVVFDVDRWLCLFPVRPAAGEGGAPGGGWKAGLLRMVIRILLQGAGALLSLQAWVGLGSLWWWRLFDWPVEIALVAFCFLTVGIVGLGPARMPRDANTRHKTMEPG